MSLLIWLVSLATATPDGIEHVLGRGHRQLNDTPIVAVDVFLEGDGADNVLAVRDYHCSRAIGAFALMQDRVSEGSRHSGEVLSQTGTDLFFFHSGLKPLRNSFP